jgi:hypothetical protein
LSDEMTCSKAFLSQWRLLFINDSRSFANFPG